MLEYLCSKCHVRGWKELDDYDFTFLKTIDKEFEVPYWFPAHKLHYPNNKSFLTRRRYDYICELFDKRNLITLSIIFHEIEKLHDKQIKNLLKLAFSASLEFVCRLNPLRPAKSRKKLYSTKSGWTVHEYWAPAIHVLNNPWVIFKSRVRKVIEGKEEAAAKFKKVIFGNDINDILKGKANVLLIRGSALNLRQYLCKQCKMRNDCKGCIDFVFTDPPYGEALQYYETDMLRNAWLFPDDTEWWKEEVVINKQQNKKIEDYYLALRRAFEEIYNVLKAGSYMVVTFHSSFIEVYNTVIRASCSVGFELEKIIFQSPAVRSAKQSLHPYTSAVGDYYMRFKKPEVI